MEVARLSRELIDMPLSRAMGRFLGIAEAVGNVEVANWCKLELAGYWASNPALNEDSVVPEYRGIVGQHVNVYGQVLHLSSQLEFVNQIRLRNGIEELETLAESRDVVSIHDPGMCSMIKEHLETDVYSFRFSSVQVKGILAAIRVMLREKITALEKSATPAAVAKASEVSGKESVFQLKPSLYGVSIDLGAIWRRYFGKR